MMIGELLKLGNSIINKIFPNAGQQKKAKQKLAEMAQKGHLQEMQDHMKMIIAEEKSKDKWTSRARPSFLYVMYIMILASIPMGFVFAYNPSLAHNMEQGFQEWLQAIPSDLWKLFGAGYLGYLGHDSYNKKKLLDNMKKHGMSSSDSP